MAVKKGPPTITVIDPTLLSDAEKDALRAQALARINKERKDAAAAAFLEQEIQTARRAFEPSQESKYITLDMAGHASYIMLDGVMYWHAQTYEVPKNVYDTLQEVVSRGWDHEDEIGGANREQYRRPRNMVLRPGMEMTPNSRLLGGR